MNKAQTEMERRVFPIEVRAADEAAAEKKTLRGYAAVFNKDSEEMMGFIERIAPGAFKKTIQEGDVRAFWNHNPDYVMGRTKSGTLRLSEDKTGLAVEIDPPDTPTMRDFVASIERGDVDQMSFGFQVVKDSWEHDRKRDLVTRTLLEVRLFEVSPVAIPAYPDTSISARTLEKLREIREQTVAEPPVTEHSDAETAPITSDPAQAAAAEAVALAEALREAEQEALAVVIAQTNL